MASRGIFAASAVVVLATDDEIQVLDLIAPGFKLAYTTGLARAMLVLAGMCAFGAAMVRVGLKDDRDKQR